MDPEPGDDHVAAVALSRGFYHNAWDADNAERMYYNLGASSLVTCRQCGVPEMAAHAREANRHQVGVKLTYVNNMPYAVTVKQALRPGNNCTNMSVTLTTTDDMPAAVVPFVPETRHQIVDTEAKTLMLTLPPNSKDKRIVLLVGYAERA
jgi:hypothetical protein